MSMDFIQNALSVMENGVLSPVQFGMLEEVYTYLLNKQKMFKYFEHYCYELRDNNFHPNQMTKASILCTLVNPCKCKSK